MSKMYRIAYLQGEIETIKIKLEENSNFGDVKAMWLKNLAEKGWKDYEFFYSLSNSDNWIAINGFNKIKPQADQDENSRALRFVFEEEQTEEGLITKIEKEISVNRNAIYITQNKQIVVVFL